LLVWFHRKHHYEDIKEVVKPFDWSYTTDYKGTVSTCLASCKTVSSATISDTTTTFATPDRSEDSPYILAPTIDSLPLDLLKRPDPILFFDELMLYEDELADNGTSFYSLKIRVMPQRLLLLARFFLRLDEVIFRIRDTRVYVEFETGQVIREYTAREAKFDVVNEELKRRIPGGAGGIGRGAEAGVADVSAAMRDPNRLVDLLPIAGMEISSTQVN
jgi:type 2A phosphatase activator TIP41